WKTELMTAFRASFNTPFHAVRTAQHASREVHSAGSEEFPDLARAHTTAVQFHLRHFTRDETEFAAHPLEQLDVALAVVTKREALAEIDFLRVQTIDDEVFEKILGANG